MDKLILKCPAKINISLDVIGKRSDGYHLLKMIMQSVELFDEITINKNSDYIRIHSSNADVPKGEDNICYRASKIMFDMFKINGGIDIFIDKNIPIAAGLAGGSTDAAGVIYGINELYNLGLSIKDMMNIGLRVGADVPYCLLSKTALAEGIGEVLTPIETLDTWCLIAKPNISVSTKEVYSKLNINDILKHPDTDKIIEHIKNKDIENMSKAMVNVLEMVTIKEYPIILNIKDVITSFDGLGSLMSGSGPSVFGIFKDINSAQKCYYRLKEELEEVYIVKTYNNGIMVI